MTSVFTTSPAIKKVIAQIAKRYDYKLTGTNHELELTHPEGPRLTIYGINWSILSFCVSFRMEGHATTPAPSRLEVIVLATTALATAAKDRAVLEENHEDDIEVNIVNDIIDDDDPTTVDFTYATSSSGTDLLHPFGMEPPLLETPEVWAERLRKLWLGDEVDGNTL